MAPHRRSAASPIETQRDKINATRRQMIEAIASRGAAHPIYTVAQISGLTSGLVGFHFRSKNQLVVESLAHLIGMARGMDLALRPISGCRRPSVGIPMPEAAVR
jgi:hypothetical protein